MRLFPLLLCPLLCLAPSVALSGQTPTADNPPPVDTKQVHPPVPVNLPEAQMPAEARRDHKTGSCDVSVVVDVNGAPQNPRVLQCTDSVFAANSLAAVRQYRFKPARTVDGDRPVAATITVTIDFRSDFDSSGGGAAEAGYEFLPPPDVTSSGPDSAGVYPLSKQLEPPRLVKFMGADFLESAFLFPDGTGCKVLLVLNANGKPKSASATQCDKPVLAKPAERVLMKSKYAPAKLNGTPVPVRLVVHLTYGSPGQ